MELSDVKRLFDDVVEQIGKVVIGQVELVEGEPPAPDESLMGERDLGWMALDIDFARGGLPLFFKATMRDGVIEVPPLDSAAVRA